MHVILDTSLDWKGRHEAVPAIVHDAPQRITPVPGGEAQAADMQFS
jgi:hypothetical protein